MFTPLEISKQGMRNKERESLTGFIFLYGFDSYRLKQKLNEIIKKHREINQSRLILKHFDFKEDDFNDFKKETQSVSIFKRKKLIILKNVFLNQDIQKKFLNWFEKVDKQKWSEIILLYEQDFIPQNKSSLFRILKKHGTCQEFKLLRNAELGKWARKTLKGYQTEISPEALEQLIIFTGNDLWQLSNEIKKIIAFKEFSNNNQRNKKTIKRIEKKEIELLVRPKIETNIFKTIDALAEKKKKQSLVLLSKHFKKGDAPLYLLSMIIYQIRNLLIIKSFLEEKKTYGQILKMSRLHPYVVRKTIEQAEKFSLNDLKKIYKKIFLVDLKIKTGKIDAQAALNFLIIGI